MYTMGLSVCSSNVSSPLLLRCVQKESMCWWNLGKVGLGAGRRGEGGMGEGGPDIWPSHAAHGIWLVIVMYLVCPAETWE